MATGIVSIALVDQGFAKAAWTLFAVNAIAYVLLWGCGFARLAAGVRDVAADLADHRAGPAFLTVVAGTCVLGVEWDRRRASPPNTRWPVSRGSQVVAPMATALPAIIVRRTVPS